MASADHTLQSEEVQELDKALLCVTEALSLVKITAIALESEEQVCSSILIPGLAGVERLLKTAIKNIKIY